MKSFRQMRTDLIETYFIKNPKLRIIITKIIFGTGRETINLAGTEFVIDKQLENGYLRALNKSEDPPRKTLFLDWGTNL